MRQQVKIVMETDNGKFEREVQRYIEGGYMTKHFSSFTDKRGWFTLVCVLESLT